MEFLLELLAPVVLIVVGAGVVIVLAVIAYKRMLAPRLQDRREQANEARLRAEVAKKAAQRSDGEFFEQDENLTDSGVFSVLEMMDALISGGNYDEAEKWALNAIHNHPNRADVPVKLAEIYYKAGRKSAFLAVVNNLLKKRLDVPVTVWPRLADMSTDLAPDEPMCAALRERAEAASAAAAH